MSWRHCSSVVSTPTTFPIRRPPSRHSTRCRSSSAWSCAHQHHRPRRCGASRRARGGEGGHVRHLGGAAPTVRGGASRAAGRCRTCACCTCSPTRWTSTWDCLTSPERVVRSAPSGAGRTRVQHSGPVPGGIAATARAWAGGAGDLARVARRRSTAGQRGTPGRHRPTGAGANVHRHRGACRRRPPGSGDRQQHPRVGDPAARREPPMVDDVVWLPTNARGCAVRRDLGVDAGDIVWVDSAGSTIGTIERRRMTRAGPGRAVHLRQRSLVADPSQGRRSLRHPRRSHALQHLARATRRGAHAATHRSRIGSAPKGCCSPSPTASSWH